MLEFKLVLILSPAKFAAFLSFPWLPWALIRRAVNECSIVWNEGSQIHAKERLCISFLCPTGGGQ